DARGSLYGGARDRPRRRRARQRPRGAHARRAVPELRGDSRAAGHRDSRAALAPQPPPQAMGLRGTAMSLPPAVTIGAALAAALSLSACQTIDAAPRCEPSVPAAVAALQEDLPGLALAGALGPDDARRFVDEVARYNGTPPAPVDGAVLLVHPPSR